MSVFVLVYNMMSSSRDGSVSEEVEKEQVTWSRSKSSVDPPVGLIFSTFPVDHVSLLDPACCSLLVGWWKLLILGGGSTAAVDLNLWQLRHVCTRTGEEKSLHLALLKAWLLANNGIWISRP